MNTRIVSSTRVKISATVVALCMLVVQGCAGDGMTLEEHPIATETTSTSQIDTDVSITEQSNDGATVVIIADHPDDEDPDNLLSVTGVVTSVTGDLSATTEVTIVTEDGVAMSFIPAASASFDGGPVAHIRDHLITGEPVRIDYIETSYGVLRATYMEDADHGH